MIYILLLICSLIFFKVKNIKYKEKIFLLCFVLISSFRNDVGIDYLNYKFLYEIKARNHEIIYSTLQNFFSKCNFHFNIFILFLSLICSILFLSFVKEYEKKIRKQVLILFLIQGYMFYSFNGIRQFIAISIFLYSIKYIKKEKLLKYSLCIILAMGFHMTAFILFPAFWLNRVIKRRVFILSAIIGLLMFNNLDILGKIVKIIVPRYSVYLNIETINQGIKIGLGMFWNQLIGIIILIFYKQIIFKNQKNNLEINLYLIGIFLTMLSYKSYLIDRIAEYFKIFSIVAIPLAFSSINLKYKILKKCVVVTFYLITTIIFIKVSLFSSNDQKINYKTIFQK